MADRIVVMDGGRIRQIGTPMDLYRTPNSVFVASFLGSPATNLITGHCVHRDGAARFVNVSLDIPLNNVVREGEMTLGIRPECLMPGDAGPGQIRLQGVVRFVEALGAESLVDLGLDLPGGAERSVTVRLPGQHVPPAGTWFEVGCNRRDLMFFDNRGDAVLTSASRH